MRSPFPPLALTAILSLPAAALSAAEAPAAPDQGLGALPASFQGQIPCADCPGIRVVLTLRPDGSFLRRMTYIRPKGGPDQHNEDQGRWQPSDDGQRVLLAASDGSTQQLAVLRGYRLGMLDGAGQAIPSRHNYVLGRDERDLSYTGPGTLRGMYSLLADAGLFTICSMGKRFPVMQEGDNAALERASNRSRHAPGEPVATSLSGHLEVRPREEGGGFHEVLVVDRFGKVLPGASCETADTPNNLDRARWKLVELNGRLVGSDAATGAPRPFLQFHSVRGQLAGSTGCNRFTAEFRTWGASGFSLLSPATTRMACSSPGAELEPAFLQALGEATHRIVAGDSLEFFSAGRPVARFQAEYLR